MIIKIIKWAFILTGLHAIISALLPMFNSTWLNNLPNAWKVFFIGALASIGVQLLDNMTYQVRELDDMAFDTMNKIYVDTCGWRILIHVATGVSLANCCLSGNRELEQAVG